MEKPRIRITKKTGDGYQNEYSYKLMRNTNPYPDSEYFKDPSTWFTAITGNPNDLLVSIICNDIEWGGLMPL